MFITSEYKNMINYDKQLERFLWVQIELMILKLFISRLGEELNII